MTARDYLWDVRDQIMRLSSEDEVLEFAAECVSDGIYAGLLEFDSWELKRFAANCERIALSFWAHRA